VVLNNMECVLSEKDIRDLWSTRPRPNSNSIWWTETPGSQPMSNGVQFDRSATNAVFKPKVAQ